MPLTFREILRDEMQQIEDLLLEKNEAYGNSVCEPMRCFSQLSPIEQIDVRIDDKLSRIARGHEYSGDDTILDLLGYLILRRVVARWDSIDD